MSFYECMCKMFHNNIPYRIVHEDGRLAISVGDDIKEFSGEDFSGAVKWMTGVMREKYPSAL